MLWLGELRQYADADGGPETLGILADLLEGDGYMAITVTPLDTSGWTTRWPLLCWSRSSARQGLTA